MQILLYQHILVDWREYRTELQPLIRGRSPPISSAGSGWVMSRIWNALTYFLSRSSLYWGVSHSSLSTVFESLLIGIWYRNLSKSNSFQNEGGLSISCMEETVIKESLNTTWNWGEMCPIRGFNMRGTLLPWLALNPTNTPFRDRGCHLGSFFPCCNVGSSTYTGHHICTSFDLMSEKLIFCE